jgi:hypothetical protein
VFYRLWDWAVHTAVWDGVIAAGFWGVFLAVLYIPAPALGFILAVAINIDWGAASVIITLLGGGAYLVQRFTRWEGKLDSISTSQTEMRTAFDKHVVDDSAFQDEMREEMRSWRSED